MERSECWLASSASVIGCHSVRKQAIQLLRMKKTELILNLSSPSCLCVNGCFLVEIRKSLKNTRMHLGCWTNRVYLSKKLSTLNFPVIQALFLCCRRRFSVSLVIARCHVRTRLRNYFWRFCGLWVFRSLNVATSYGAMGYAATFPGITYTKTRSVCTFYRSARTDHPPILQELGFSRDPLSPGSNLSVPHFSHFFDAPTWLNAARVCVCVCLCGCFWNAACEGYS